MKKFLAPRTVVVYIELKMLELRLLFCVLMFEIATIL